MKGDNLSEFCVIVTGAGGLIGASLVDALRGGGASVIAMDIAEPVGAQREIAEGYDFLVGGMGYSLKQAEKLLAVRKPNQSVFIHLAGISHAGRCEKDPKAAFETNLNLTVSALEFCRRNKVDTFVFPSTGLLYGDSLMRPAVEKDKLVIANIYAATKLAAEAVVKEYSKRFGVNTVITRFSNIYGACSGSDTVIGTVLAQLRSGASIRLRDLTPVRDFLYVEDAVRGMLLALLRASETGENYVFNISSGVATSIRELAEAASSAALPLDEKICRDCDDSDGEPGSYLVLDNSLINMKTGWSPRYSLEDGLLLSLGDNFKA